MVKQEACKKQRWPRQAAAAGLAALLALFMLPMLFLRGEKREEEPVPTATLPVVDAVNPVPGWDEGQQLRLLKGDGTVENVTLNEYLWGVVAAEMPASFRLEALKAQTVAARTYCLYQRAGAGDKHPGADVCTDHTCCQAYLSREQAQGNWGSEAQRYTDKITQAVEETNGLLCLYQGAPIDAVFFSSAAGRTSDASAVWGGDVPYLTSVDSPEGEEVPGWQTVVSFTPAEFVQRFQEVHPEAELSGDPTGWITDRTEDRSGAVEGITIGGVRVTGGQARSIFGLRSAHFTLEATADVVTFQVTGYGHGVGMSQYGANAMAAQGKNFQQILEWYYTGAAVSGWEGE